MMKLLLSSVGPEHKGKPSCVTGSNHSSKAVGSCERVISGCNPNSITLGERTETVIPRKLDTSWLFYLFDERLARNEWEK